MMEFSQVESYICVLLSIRERDRKRAKVVLTAEKKKKSGIMYAPKSKVLTQIPAEKVDIELNLNVMNEQQSKMCSLHSNEQNMYICELVFVYLCVHLDDIRVTRRNKNDFS